MYEGILFLFVDVLKSVNPDASLTFLEVLKTLRDCSLFIGSTGPAFRGTGQGLFLMLPSTGHQDLLCFYGTGHELFWKKSLKLYLYNISGW